jgi:glyoxylase-like metal-dependent hydrolase (beta-lactamase superfamily II)
MTEIIPGVHVIDCGMVQAYLVQDADRLTLIDTGLATCAPAIVDTITGAGRALGELRQIVVTHYHVDHRGSVAELAERTGARVLAHRLDAPMMRGDLAEEEPVLSELEKPYAEQVRKDLVLAPFCNVDLELGDGDEIDVAGGAQVVHVPGHTRGSIAVYLPKKRALFCGDAAARMPEGQLIVGVFNVDPAQARASFRRLAELEFDAAFFGHGAPMDRDASLAFRKVAERLHPSPRGEGLG